MSTSAARKELFANTAYFSELQASFPAKSTQASLNTGEELPFHDVWPQPVTIQRLPGLKKIKLSGKQIWLTWRPYFTELDRRTRAEWRHMQNKKLDFNKQQYTSWCR